jgi:hypothetical protein
VSTTEGEVIVRPASAPDADLACEYEVAGDATGLQEELAAASIAVPVRIEHGIEARFRGDAWPAVARYVDIESQCCPFLDLEARRTGDVIILRVTGRAEAQGIIASTFGLEPSAGSQEEQP